MVWGSKNSYLNIVFENNVFNQVIIWKEVGTEWTNSYEYNNHESSVNSIQWAPVEFGLCLACGSSDGTISFLISDEVTENWTSKKILNAHSIGINAISWCPTFEKITLFDNQDDSVPVKRLVSGGCDNLVKTWKEVDNVWVEEAKFDLHSDWVRDVAWSPSLGYPDTVIASCSQDRRVIVWSSKDFVNWTPTILNTFDDVVWNVSWSLTGDVLSVSYGQNNVSLWRSNSEGKWVNLTDFSNDSNRQSQITEE